MDRQALIEEIDAFVDDHRDHCLWFVRTDFRPTTDEERRWVLTQIQRRSNQSAFARAATLKRWLSPRSNDASAAS
jgi:hypothetical protein